ncbi:hypothetical protein SAMD00023353_0105210 [Rosellinia necatrix]|uniref:Uncharacterized protein n=1 Tax=Rosellinia necatrix TaxID=77044 RepID=A0A1S8A5G0_ROSNE|nr:hypothetical protein SAMD00023353_0105210 [Rosellinia necatrix]
MDPGPYHVPVLLALQNTVDSHPGSHCFSAKQTVTRHNEDEKEAKKKKKKKK